MVTKETIVNVTNRDNGTVLYTIPDLGVRREFAPKEVKQITAEELRKLSYIGGGKYLLENCLTIDNSELVQELLGEVEPEYFYSEAEVKELLLNGSIDQLIDCLNFAPNGVIDILKQYAVEFEINDIQKRRLIQEKTGFDVSRAIAVRHEAAEGEEATDEPTTTRRSAPIKVSSEQTSPQRKATTPKYKIKN